MLILLFIAYDTSAQDKMILDNARSYVAQKQLDKAAELYQKLYDQSPDNNDVYYEYLTVLLEQKNTKTAEKIVSEQLKHSPQNPLYKIDLGHVYLVNGKTGKAEKEFDEALDMINGDDMLTQQMANVFGAMGRDDYALKTYERARDLLRNPYLYSGPMSRLYAKAGDIEKAIIALLDNGTMQFGGMEEIKSTMLEFLGTDAKRIQQAQKTLIKKINEQPENPYFGELLTWLYTQKDDWEGALIQIQAIDERNKEFGNRLLDFARSAVKEQQYDIAIKTYDAVIAKGNDKPYYATAHSEKLNTKFLQLRNNIAFTPEHVTTLAAEYDAFLKEFPQFYMSQIGNYATLEAQYGNNSKKAVALLKDAIEKPGAPKQFVGQWKLQLGDYQILDNDMWEASLTYSQVDKAFREDALGEEARFRNAKLAYYRGDFEWAQGQLTVLKGSTTELIANDALYLSVLITENITPDSNYVPIRRFAYADLLLFQNKDKEAEALLDSINTNFPEHPLKDDILMQRATLARKHKDFNKALNYLKEIYEKHGDDVLGDDAIFKSAELYEAFLNNKEEAKKLYADLIIKYPGSTYIQTARKKLDELGRPVVP